MKTRKFYSRLLYLADVTLNCKPFSKGKIVLKFAVRSLEKKRSQLRDTAMRTSSNNYSRHSTLRCWRLPQRECRFLRLYLQNPMITSMEWHQKIKRTKDLFQEVTLVLHFQIKTI